MKEQEKKLPCGMNICKGMHCWLYLVCKCKRKMPSQLFTSVFWTTTTSETGANDERFLYTMHITILSVFFIIIIISLCSRFNCKLTTFRPVCLFAHFFLSVHKEIVAYVDCSVYRASDEWILLLWNDLSDQLLYLTLNPFIDFFSA